MTAVPAIVVLHRLDDTLATRSTLELLRWWDATGRRPDLVLAVHDGPLRGPVAEVSPLQVVNPDHGRRPSRLLQVAHLHRPAEVVRGVELRRWLRSAGRSALLADVGAARLLHWLDADAPVAALVHAAAPDAAAEESEPDARLLAERCRGWIVGSPAAARTLDGLGTAAPVAHHHDLLPRHLLLGDPARPTTAARRAETRARLARDHGIPADGPLVVGVGQRDWWHTGNAFVEAVWRLREAVPGLRAAWVALSSSERMLWPLRHDIDHAGLGGTVRVLAMDPPPMEVIAAADLVLDTEHTHPSPSPHARSAPAPPSAVDTPVVAFAPDASGEANATDDGWEVPFLDLPALVAQVRAALPGGAEHRARPELATWDVEVGGPLLQERLDGWLR